MATVSYTSLESSFSSSISSDSGKPLGFDTSSAITLLASTSFLWSAGIMISVVAAGFMYMRAGIIRMQASEAGVRKSNEEIKRVTLGLLGVLSLFVILYTFNKGLLQGDVGLEGLRANPVGTSVFPPAVSSSTPKTVQPSIPAHNDDPSGWAAIQRDPQIRAQLASLPNGGISVNKQVCTTPTQTSCTTVGWSDSATPNMLAQLRNICSGGIEVSGGTEAEHKSHGPNLRPVDISMNKPGGLNDCIRSFPKGPPLSYCKATYTSFGYIFCDEFVEGGTAHWHVQ